MIVTVEGYNRKKNRATFVASALSAYSAMGLQIKTLLIELIPKDIDTAERDLIGVGKNRNVNDRTMNIGTEGIDPLLRLAGARNLTKDDFAAAVTPILKKENMFDIATVTQTDGFIGNLKEKDRMDALSSLLTSAKEIYENIILLLPTKDKELCEQIRGLTETVPDPKDEDGIKTIERPFVDWNIYCIHQGYQKEYDARGKRIVYLISEYDRFSKFKLSDVSREYIGAASSVINLTGGKKQYCYKLTRNIEANDAVIDGTLARFVRQNRELEVGSLNYMFVDDMLRLTKLVFGEKDEEDKELSWEDMEFEPPVPKIEEKAMFGKKKEKPVEKPVTKKEKVTGPVVPNPEKVEERPMIEDATQGIEDEVLRESEQELTSYLTNYQGEADTYRNFQSPEEAAPAQPKEAPESHKEMSLSEAKAFLDQAMQYRKDLSDQLKREAEERQRKAEEETKKAEEVVRVAEEQVKAMEKKEAENGLARLQAQMAEMQKQMAGYEKVLSEASKITGE